MFNQSYIYITHGDITLIIVTQLIAKCLIKKCRYYFYFFNAANLIKKAHLNLYHILLNPPRCIFTPYCSLYEYTKKVEMKRKVNCKVNNFQSIPTHIRHISVCESRIQTPRGAIVFREIPRTNP